MYVSSAMLRIALSGALEEVTCQRSVAKTPVFKKLSIQLGKPAFVH